MTGTDRTKFMGKKYKRVTDMTETDKTESGEISTKESQTVLKQTRHNSRETSTDMTETDKKQVRKVMGNKYERSHRYELNQTG